MSFLLIALASCTNVHKTSKNNNNQLVALKNPLDSLYSCFIKETPKASQYFIFIYQSPKGIIVTFRANNDGNHLVQAISPILKGEKNGKQFYVYTGIEHLFKFDTLEQSKISIIKNNPYFNMSKSYIIYDDKHIESLKNSIPPFAPPPDELIEVKKISNHL